MSDATEWAEITEEVGEFAPEEAGSPAKPVELTIVTIETKEQFKKTIRLYELGGTTLSFGYCPEQWEVIVAMLSLHKSIERAPFKLDESGEIIEKATQTIAEAAGSVS